MEITDFLQDAKRLAKWFNRFGDHDYEELYAAALLGATQGVRWVEAGRCKHDNPRAYVLVTMKRFIRECIYQNHLIVVPIKKVRAYKKEGEEHKLPLFFTKTQSQYQALRAIIGRSPTDFGNDDYVVYDPLNLKGAKDDPSKHVTWIDFCNHLGITEEERKVIDLKLQGFDLMRMSKELGCSHMTVKRKLESIKLKLAEWYHAYQSHERGHQEGQRDTTNSGSEHVQGVLQPDQLGNQQDVERQAKD